MIIAFLSYLHGFGGAEKQIVMLANEMAERGHNVYLITIGTNNNQYAIKQKVKYVYIPDRSHGVSRIVTRYYDIKSILRGIKPEVTINFWFQSAYLCAAMSKRTTGALLYSERGDPSDKEYTGLLGFVRKISSHRISRFVFQSQAAKRCFSKKIQERSVIIPNPVIIDEDICQKKEERKKTIVTIGRLHPQKNHELLINAFGMIAKQIPDYSLEIYGEGELKDKIEDLILNLGLGERVYLKGVSTNVLSSIRNASLFVLSSDYEGMPNTLLEAMAMGIPCISTDYKPGGVSEIISNHYDGEIVPRSNKELLAESMIKLIFDEEKRNLYSQNAKKKMEEFNSGAIYDRWEEHIKNLSNG